MQKDFHYNVIKILATKGGFSKEDSELIAYASQYVDDAVLHQKFKLKGYDNSLGYERFKKGKFNPICTAHKGLGYINGLRPSAQKKVYVSFHFIPNKKRKNGKFFSFLTKENGEIANKLINIAISEYKNAKDKKNKELQTQKLIKLGIAIHSYADTYSHQGFSGIHSSYDNDIEDIRKYKNGVMKDLGFWKSIKSNISPNIGHAEAGSFPDRTNLKWEYEYENPEYHEGDKTERDNSKIFLRASKNILKFFCEINGSDFDKIWGELENQLFSYLKKENSVDTYEEIFGVDFNYKPKEWFKAAIKSEEELVINTGSDMFYRITHDFNGDMKWFYFQYEAYEQRKFMIGE